jgi:coenzyme F420-reducing hydrogenase delta subunit
MDLAQGGAREPVIVGFLCTWCAYLAADAAGMARVGYPPSLRPIRVTCSSRVEPEFVLQALRDGADGVMIAACHPGACHFGDGNLKALRRFALLVRLLDQMGVERERVQLVWVAASEAAALAVAVERMTRQLRALGPLAWAETVLRGEAPGW